MQDLRAFVERLAYFTLIVPLTVALASGSIALTQVDVKETPKEMHVELPADVLFAFGESKAFASSQSIVACPKSSWRSGRVCTGPT